MAAALHPDDVLRSTDGKANFQRLARLLISGGTALFREIFDNIYPPSNLPLVLSNPATQKQLKAAKLTKPQWDCLYPYPGGYGKSVDFDVTLLFRLLRTICNLSPPPMGWDVLPASSDVSLTADLARIKYYRNSIFGHVNQHMEIPNGKFLILWQEIGDALVRIAGQIGHSAKTAWQTSVDNFLGDPLTPDDGRNAKELERWYMNDMDVKKSMEALKATTHERFDRLETGISYLQALQEEFAETTQTINWGVRRLESAFRVETQDIKDQLREMHRLIDAGFHSAGVHLTNVYGDSTADSTGHFVQWMPITPQASQAVGQGMKMTAFIPPHPTMYRESPAALKILKKLWKHYHADESEEMARAFIEAEDILRECGQIEECSACSRPRTNQHAATGTVSLQIRDVSDPPKKQDSVNEVREKFAQLRRLRKELQKALFRWILIRGTTIRLLKSLAVHLKDVGSEVTVQNGLFNATDLVAAATGAAIPLMKLPSFFGALAIVAEASIVTTIIIATTLLDLHAHEKIVGRMLDEVQASIMEDQEACLKIQQQLDFLENFILTLAEFLIPLNDNVVLLKEMGESGFEFFYKWIACEDMDPSTVTNVEFCEKFLRATMSEATMSSSILYTICADFLRDIKLFGISSFWRHRGFVSETVKDIRRILVKLECPVEKAEIQGLVQSFIQGSFNNAYRRMKSDRKREYHSDKVVNADDH